MSGPQSFPLVIPASPTRDVAVFVLGDFFTPMTIYRNIRTAAAAAASAD